MELRPVSEVRGELTVNWVVANTAAENTVAENTVVASKAAENMGVVSKAAVNMVAVNKAAEMAWTWPLLDLRGIQNDSLQANAAGMLIKCHRIHKHLEADSGFSRKPFHRPPAGSTR